jgi:hypothetical protein
MAQQLTNAGNAVCSDAMPAAGLTPAGSSPRPLTADDALKVLPPLASQALREAIQSGCCIHYTVAEGECQAGGCGNGRCCYHVVSTACSINEYMCLDLPCSTGNFSIGC